jgi:Xaa-Pro dipeptidase
MRKAATIAEAGMQAAVDAVRGGATEVEINVAAENAMSEFWSQGYSDDDIVGFGDGEDGVISALWCWTRAGERIGISLPASTNKEIPNGEAVLVVIWTTINGYGAELERTIFKGTPTQERRAAYEVMMSVRESVRRRVRPGTVCADLVTLTADLMRKSGFDHGPGFIGHGLGLGHHEQPHILPGQTTRLQPGMVFALEPGMLFPDYGVRHSDTILVTDDGSVSLTSWNRFTEGWANR